MLRVQWIFFFSGEVERLLREYTQNQEMIRNIGSTYYQIVYPVQLRQHKKIGISTREIGSSKVRKARSTVCHSTFSSHSPPLYVIVKYLLLNKWSRNIQPINEVSIYKKAVLRKTYNVSVRSVTTKRYWLPLFRYSYEF